MNRKVLLVHHKDTGHVLGAITRAGGFDKSIAVADAVGDGLWVRNTRSQNVGEKNPEKVGAVMIEAGWLNLLLTDANQDYLRRPRSYFALGSAVAEADPTEVVSILIDTDQRILVKLSALATTDIAVFVVAHELDNLEEGSRQTLEGTIPTGKDRAELHAALLPPPESDEEPPAAPKVSSGKTYVVLALVEGLTPRFEIVPS